MNSVLVNKVFKDISFVGVDLFIVYLIIFVIWKFCNVLWFFLEKFILKLYDKNFEFSLVWFFMVLYDVRDL